jgi:prepilin-type N-terminal cleavage/methylation domain-containing protein
MMSARIAGSQRGFTLVEMLVSVAIFVVICGAIFSLLNVAQKRNQTEMQLVSSFQDARLGLDQIIRDVDDSGYPPQNQFSVTPAANLFAYSPVAWSPSYPATPCLIGTAGGGTCVSPGDFDVIFEEALSNNNAGVVWIRYQLQGTTLSRGVVNKTAGADPVAATSAAGVMISYVLNVVNNAPAAQIAQFRTAYPSMFPGGNPQPIFQFNCDTPGGPVLCQNAGIYNSPVYVRDVQVRLIVKTLVNDAQTGLPRLVELNGRGHRLNPNR